MPFFVCVPLAQFITIPAPLICYLPAPFFSLKSLHFAFMPQFNYNHSISSTHILNSMPDLSVFFFLPVFQSLSLPPLPLSSIPHCHAFPPALQMQSLYGTHQRSRPCVCR